jgi:NADH-quinone oxidoreductase subunit N
LLATIFGLCAFWFFAADAAGAARRLVPLGLIIAALLVSSIAVQPFLYAALLIELAVLAAIPLLVPDRQRPGGAVVRYLIYQTLGMPFILYAGWLLAGVEASPGDLSMTVQATVMLGLGFAFLLAVFPLNDWMPRLMEEANPYVAGFLLWLLPNMIVIFGMGFLDRYAWLRTSAQVVSGMRWIGLTMLVLGGLWAFLAKHLGRIMAFATMAETGCLFLALSLAGSNRADVAFIFLIPRGIGITVWALGLSVLRGDRQGLEIENLRGAARSHPWASAAVSLAALSTAGVPLLAGFPARVALWAGLAQESRAAAIWYFIGLAALTAAAIRQIAVLFVSVQTEEASESETTAQRGMLGVGMVVLCLLGLSPQLLAFVVGRLPAMFEHLSR